MNQGSVTGRLRAALRRDVRRSQHVPAGIDLSAAGPSAPRGAEFAERLRAAVRSGR